MNREFHYYVTHLIAARAGIRGDDLRVLAYASQYVDDNSRGYSIKGSGLRTPYENNRSQTMNILRPHKDKLEIYPLFHFIPGEPDAPSARRSDGKTNVFNTTPNSLNANRMMDAALETQNFYRIGIAAHAYVDTWAHQNFVGDWTKFNAFPGFLAWLTPDCGHADAGHKPDEIGLTWQDVRLVDSSVDNNQRFREAAEHLFGKFWGLVNSTRGTASAVAQMTREQQALIADLRVPMEKNASKERHADYHAFATSAAYGATPIPDYDKEAWFNQTVKTTTGATPGSRRPGNRNVKTTLNYTFRPGYQDSDWYAFQEAVKRHAECVKAILCETPAIAQAYKA